MTHSIQDPKASPFGPHPQILRRRQVEARMGLSRSTIYDRINRKSPNYEPGFPKPIALGPKSVGWIESEISEYLTRQIERSRQ